MTGDLLIGWGMGQQEAKRLVSMWEMRGWLEKDARKGNARVITAKLADLATNRQSQQSPTNPLKSQQTAQQTQQSLYFGGVTA